MVLKEHASLSACGAAAVYLAVGRWPPALAFAVAGVLIDLDHLVDYWRDDGFNLDVRRFMGYFRARRPRHLLLGLHGWEWPLTLGAVALGVSAPPWVWALEAGWLAHLALDQRFNPGQRVWSYWFAWRLRRGFRAPDFYEPGQG